jgi:hypothetical protein
VLQTLPEPKLPGQKLILQAAMDKSYLDVQKPEDVAEVSIWDFAGRFVFSTAHQAFLTSRGFYLLVLDITKELDDEVDDEICIDIYSSDKIWTVRGL